MVITLWLSPTACNTNSWWKMFFTNRSYYKPTVIMVFFTAVLCTNQRWKWCSFSPPIHYMNQRQKKFTPDSCYKSSVKITRPVLINPTVKIPLAMTISVPLDGVLRAPSARGNGAQGMQIWLHYIIKFPILAQSWRGPPVHCPQSNRSCAARRANFKLCAAAWVVGCRCLTNARVFLLPAVTWSCRFSCICSPSS